MAAGLGNEKQSLGKFVKSQTKYGTTTTVMPKNRCSNYVKHRVVSGDTLARLALKYSVTVEQLKRDNKLWSSDSLFSKEHVFIPVTRDNSEGLPEGAVIVGSDCVRAAQHSSQKQNGTGDSLQTDARVAERLSGSVNDTAVNSNTSHSGKDAKTDSGTKGSALDFLNKYDSSIAQLKTNVKKMEQNAAFLEKDFPLAASYLPRRHTVGNVSTPGSGTSALYKRHSYDLDSDSSPILVIRSRTKEVQSSLERLEKTNDEFFQL